MRKFLAFLLAACLLVSAAPALALNNDDAALADNWYEIFVYSFADGNGDRIGDFIGLKEKLPYLQSLHVDGVWLMPIHPSPSYHKYDVTDYCAIDPQYGTLADFQAFLEAAHEAGIKVILDLVVNHTSSEHPWFQASRRGEEPYKDYYIWRKPKKDGTLPNNWDSMFEGKAWQYDEVRKAYYLHIFAIKQRVEQLLTQKMQDGYTVEGICKGLGLNKKQFDSILKMFDQVNTFEQMLKKL